MFSFDEDEAVDLFELFDCDDLENCFDDDSSEYSDDLDRSRLLRSLDLPEYRSERRCRESDSLDDDDLRRLLLLFLLRDDDSRRPDDDDEDDDDDDLLDRPVPECLLDILLFHISLANYFYTLYDVFLSPYSGVFKKILSSSSYSIYVHDVFWLLSSAANENLC